MAGFEVLVVFNLIREVPRFLKRGPDFFVSVGAQAPTKMPRSGNEVMGKPRSGLRISA